MCRRRSRARIYLPNLIMNPRPSWQNLCQLPPERHAFTRYKEWASRLRAAIAVVDAVAVADPKVSLGAEHPDRLLERRGKNAGPSGQNWRAAMRLAVSSMMLAQPPRP